MTNLMEDIFFAVPPSVQFRYEGYLSIFYRIFIVFHIVIDGRISTIDRLICMKARRASSFLLSLIFSLYFCRNCTSSVSFKVRKSSSVALEYTSINFIFFRTYFIKKNARKTLQPKMLYTYCQER